MITSKFAALLEGAAVRSTCFLPGVRSGSPRNLPRVLIPHAAEDLTRRPVSAKFLLKRVFPCHKWQTSSPVRIATPRFPAADGKSGLVFLGQQRPETSLFSYVSVSTTD